MIKKLYMKIKYKIIKDNNKVIIYYRFKKTMLPIITVTLKDVYYFIIEKNEKNKKEANWLVEYSQEILNKYYEPIEEPKKHMHERHICAECLYSEICQIQYDLYSENVLRCKGCEHYGEIIDLTNDACEEFCKL